MKKSRVTGPESRVHKPTRRGDPSVTGRGSRVPKRTKDSRLATRDSRPPNEGDLVAVGVVRKAHGVRGEASVEPLTDSLQRFEELRDVFLVSPDRKTIRPANIDGARVHTDRVLVHLRGIESPEEVRGIANWSIEIRPDQLRPVGHGEYFLHDLIGLKVVTPDDESIGITTDAQESSAGVLLTVRKDNGRTFEVPFAEAICREIDLESKRIVAEIPAGLDELDRVSAVEDDPAPETASLRIDVVTIFPRLFDAFLEEGVLARAHKERLLRIKVWDLRDFTRDKHRSTDDQAYGGGGGMVMLGEPIFRCLDAIRSEEDGEPHVVLMSPQGRKFDQESAAGLARKHWLVVVCGRYEGIDERVRTALVHQEVSVGDFVVSGGEIPAMLVIEALARMVEGVVGDWNSVKGDSFYNGLLDHPHYTRPAELRGQRVPEVLLSGHAEKIRKWRKEQALRATLVKRPDLLETAELDEEARQILDMIRREMQSVK